MPGRVEGGVVQAWAHSSGKAPTDACRRSGIDRSGDDAESKVPVRCDTSDDLMGMTQLQAFSTLGQTVRAPVGLERTHLMHKFAAKLKARLVTREEGATAVEYGLMVALIAIVIIVAVALLGTNLSTLFNRAATSI
jgi:pilus assembly protein Flp/PilA